jgi:patatin-like phospholipase/acyl hydrolase
MKKVLSCDGGGIRGVITAVWLEAIQERLDKPLVEYIDVVSGTSTGAIIACAISSGYSANEIVDLFIEKGNVVFPSFWRRIWDRLFRVLYQGLDAPRYNGRGLRKVLQDAFGDKKLKDLHISTVVTSYNMANSSALILKSKSPFHEEMYVWEACLASASAPTYFPAFVIDWTKVLIDGGVVMNNPSLCGIVEAKIEDNNEIICISMGTGKARNRANPRQAKNMGFLRWAIPILDVLFDGSEDAVDYISRNIVGEERYERMQARIPRKLYPMDKADNVMELVELARKYAKSEEGQKKIEAIAKLLKSA